MNASHTPDPSAPGNVSRRRFLASSAAASLLLGGTVTACAQQPKPTVKGPSRSVIFLVSDGMNHGTLAAAHHYKQRFLDGATHWTQLYGREGVFRGLQETLSANALVTDSAAAGSSWGCGERVNNRSLNITPSGAQPKPLALKIKEKGKSVGLVTTTRLTHATPASFAINIDHRDKEDAIAAQYLSRGIDLLLGGGSRHFEAAKRADGEDLFVQYEKAGYRVLKDRGALMDASIEAKPLLGTFWGSHLPYSIDRQRDRAIAKRVPTLAELTQAALDRLDLNPEGFLLQVEGGRVDHAGHANDPGAIVRDQLAFDDCIAVALEYQAKHPDTLVIVTTDHGTGGLDINGQGSDYLDANRHFENLTRFNRSWESLAEAFAPEPTLDNLRSLYREATQLDLPSAAAENVVAAWNEALANDANPAYATSGLLGKAAAEVTAMDWTSGAHTADLVETAAIGPGAERLKPFIRNYEVHRWVLDALAI